MGKYVQLFKNHETYEVEPIKPHIAHCIKEAEVHYREIMCILTLNNGSTVEIEGSGTLTSALTNSYSASCVSAVILSPCTSIGYAAFNEFSRITSCTISDSVSSIGVDAFGNCRMLKNVNLPNNVTVIDVRAFYYCTSLTSFTISSESSLTRINAQAFQKCSGLTEIIIPNGVVSIGDSAFNECTSLISVSIGNGVKSIGNDSFGGCRMLNRISIPSGVTSIDVRAFYNCSSLSLVICNPVTPPTLGSQAFYNTNNCPIKVLPQSVEAYKSASGWNELSSRIQEIVSS